MKKFSHIAKEDMHFQKFEKYALFKKGHCDFWRAGPPGHLANLCVSVCPLSLNQHKNPIESETVLGNKIQMPVVVLVSATP